MLSLPSPAWWEGGESTHFSWHLVMTAPSLVTGLGIALMGAGAAHALHIPLPWLLGPLIVVAVCRMQDVACVCPRPLRRAGQWVIGISLGLYFTPQVAASLLGHWPLVLLTVLWALALGAFGCWVLQRFAAVDPASAWFGAAIGGSAEMVNLAERYRAKCDIVATVHSLRVALVVLTVPFALQWLGTGTPAPIAALPRDVQPLGLLCLTLGSCTTAVLLQRLRLPNAWVIGPMAFALAFTVQEIHLSALPQSISWAGQLCIGWSLGSNYHPQFFKTAPRLTGVVTLFTLSMLALCALLAWALTHFVHVPFSTVLLGLAPGGIAEMTLTARALELGVPLITAMHILRMLAVVLLAGPLFQWKWGKR